MAGELLGVWLATVAAIGTFLLGGQELDRHSSDYLYLLLTISTSGVARANRTAAPIQGSV